MKYLHWLCLCTRIKWYWHYSAMSRIVIPRNFCESEGITGLARLAFTFNPSCRNSRFLPPWSIREIWSRGTTRVIFNQVLLYSIALYLESVHITRILFTFDPLLYPIALLIHNKTTSIRWLIQFYDECFLPFDDENYKNISQSWWIDFDQCNDSWTITRSSDVQQ